MATLRFDVNVPQEVALKFDAGKRIASRYENSPDQVMYTICGDDAIFVPLIVEEQIKQLGIRKMELISICKRQQNGVTRWEVKRLSDAAESAAPPVSQQVSGKSFETLPTEINATPTERQLTQSINHARQQKAQQALPAPAEQARTQVPMQANPNTQANSNAAPIRHTISSALMAGCLIAAIDASLEAERYAESKSIELEFTTEDIRTIAATIFINASKTAQYAEQGGSNGGARAWQQ